MTGRGVDGISLQHERIVMWAQLTLEFFAQEQIPSLMMAGMPKSGKRQNAHLATAEQSLDHPRELLSQKIERAANIPISPWDSAIVWPVGVRQMYFLISILRHALSTGQIPDAGFIRITLSSKAKRVVTC
jgi:hypothetical protein